MYEQLAHLYDWPGALDFSDIIVEKVEQLLRAHDLTPPSAILDLGCGTGTVCVAMAQDGWQMTGLDIS